MKFFTSLLFIAVSLISNAQLQSSKWFFGNHAGLDFSGANPVPISGGQVVTYEGTSIMCGPTGNLLFYSDGSTVWDANHQVMANGTGLFGNTSSTQSCLIIKQPGNNNIYFIFTVDYEAHPNGLNYSAVDLALSTTGSVTAKNVPLHSLTTEKLTAVRHCNGTDTWVISHDYNSSNFRVFLVSSAGVSTSPVVSAVGSIHTSSYLQGIGQMKASPNGKRLGVAMLAQNMVQLFDFNASTGVVSNPQNIASFLSSPYGCEFSPDGTKMYVSRFTGGQIMQWDLCAGSLSAIIASQYTIATYPNVPVGSLQLAPDGKIYLARLSEDSLGVINNPNSAGAACNFVNNGQYIGATTCSLGLPGFAVYYQKTAPPAFNHLINSTTNCKLVTFTAPALPSQGSSCAASNYSYSGISWNFGDPASGINNTSASSTPSHTFTAFGTFDVKLIFHSACGNDTVTQKINVVGPQLSVTGTTLVCAGSQATLLASGASSYTWNGTVPANSLVTTPTATSVYTLTGITGANCLSTITTQVLYQVPPTLTVTGAGSKCKSDNKTFTMAVTGATNYTWSGGQQTNSVTITPTVTTGYTVSGNTPGNSCKGSAAFTLNVLPCVSVTEEQVNQQFYIYPNPATDFIAITLLAENEGIIFDATAKKVMEIKLRQGSNTIPVSDLPGGFYSLVLKDGQRVNFIRTDTK